MKLEELLASKMATSLNEAVFDADSARRVSLINRTQKDQKQLDSIRSANKPKTLHVHIEHEGGVVSKHKLKVKPVLGSMPDTEQKAQDVFNQLTAMYNAYPNTSKKPVKIVKSVYESADLDEAVTPEEAHNLLKKHGVSPTDSYFQHSSETVAKVKEDGKKLGIKHNASSKAAGKSEGRHVFDRLASLASKHRSNESVVHSQSLTNQILSESWEFPTSKKFSELFKQLVPGQGKADTVEGELVRAFGKIKYRFYNDGDVFFENEGCNTAGPAMTYLYHCSVPGVPNAIREYIRKIPTVYKEVRDAKDYEKMLSTLEGMIVKYVESMAGRYTKNVEDYQHTKSMWEYKEEDDGDYGQYDESANQSTLSEDMSYYTGTLDDWKHECELEGYVVVEINHPAFQGVPGYHGYEAYTKQEWKKMQDPKYVKYSGVSRIGYYNPALKVGYLEDEHGEPIEYTANESVDNLGDIFVHVIMKRVSGQSHIGGGQEIAKSVGAEYVNSYSSKIANNVVHVLKCKDSSIATAVATELQKRSNVADARVEDGTGKVY